MASRDESYAIYYRRVPWAAYSLLAFRAARLGYTDRG